jgi:hypothetical protein
MSPSHLVLFSLLLAGQPAAENSPAQAAAQLLDEKLPANQRRQLAEESAAQAAAVVAALVADLPAGDADEEYRRIPWIWRVSVAAGRKNQIEPLRALLGVSLPKEGEKLRDWQAVVIGGGIIGGISQSGPWPQPRVEQLIGDDESLGRRWGAAVAAAAAMADDARIKPGTRYDALRMIALVPSPKHLAQLARYLKDSNTELQMGAVSGLADVDSPQATKLLAAALPDLAPANRKLAIDALLRNGERIKALRGLVESGQLPREALSDSQLKLLDSGKQP